MISPPQLARMQRLKTRRRQVLAEGSLQLPAYRRPEHATGDNLYHGTCRSSQGACFRSDVGHFTTVPIRKMLPPQLAPWHLLQQKIGRQAAWATFCQLPAFHPAAAPIICVDDDLQAARVLMCNAHRKKPWLDRRPQQHRPKRRRDNVAVSLTGEARQGKQDVILDAA